MNTSTKGGNDIFWLPKNFHLFHTLLRKKGVVWIMPIFKSYCSFFSSILANFRFTVFEDLNRFLKSFRNVPSFYEMHCFLKTVVIIWKLSWNMLIQPTVVSGRLYFIIIIIFFLFFSCGKKQDKSYVCN